jgi:hypothetical protein
VCHVLGSARGSREKGDGLFGAMGSLIAEDGIVRFVEV